MLRQHCQPLEDGAQVLLRKETLEDTDLAELWRDLPIPQPPLLPLPV